MTRKSSYTANGPQDQFIVPLLNREITISLESVSNRITYDNLTPSALDCGCGNQPLRGMIQDLGLSYESLDVAQNSFSNVDYICSIEDHPGILDDIITKEFSLIVCTEVIEHVINLQQSFANLNRLLVNGGFLIITSPFFYPLHEEPVDYYRPTIHILNRLACQNGFQVLTLKKAGCAVDIMATLLGSAPLRFDTPRTFSEKIKNRFLIKIQKTLYSLVIANYQRLASDNQGVYLSNIAILRKTLSIYRQHFIDSQS